ncbi:uncharacterized protein LOC128553926 [Mercenaria mercenaria]|uniref:uncharacterized protein LOC128553926 n=1 Tax=Mercenaria mercenaria TaxID=6596 RepID=UPI00234FA846|nr:uncharacterized protein LOC128553926 [Mercenaria mercenaria]
MDRDEDYQTFVVVYKGLSYVGKVLEPYTENGLQRTHQDIYKALGGYPPCQSQCSLQHGKTVNSWCNTCKKWKKYLARTTRIPFESWDEIESWKWPMDFRSIAAIYLPKGSANHPVDLADLSVACNIWCNCKNAFNVRRFVIQHLRDTRNRYFAHNLSRLQVTPNEKARAFDAFSDAIKDPDLVGFVDKEISLQELEKIKDGDELIVWMKELADKINQHSVTLDSIKQNQNVFAEAGTQQSRALCDIQQTQHGAVEVVVQALEDIKKETLNMGKVKRSSVPLNIRRKIVSASVIATIIFLTLVVIWPTKKITHERKEKACLSENYSYPFKQDLPLMGYLNEHKELKGRKWLLDDLVSLFLESETNYNGVTLVAEMGYGKSAIISHLLCANTDDKQNILREHICGFNLCRFNVKSTQYPERFVKRLVGFLATTNAAYGNIISRLPDSSILFNSDACAKEIDACFDQGITLPLKEMSAPEKIPWIIAVDAIDECYDETLHRNPILDMLSSRINLLPHWIQFLITSRNITELNKFRNMKQVHLFRNNANNLNDINSYIETYYTEKKWDVDTETLKNLTLQSEGNFLYITHLLQFLTNTKCNGILPRTLADIYEINFDRQYSGNVSFHVSRAILEVICASLNPLSKNNIMDILTSNNITDKNNFEDHFGRLIFFLRLDKKVTIIHQAMHKWLVSEQNAIYRIFPESGHAIIAKHLFEKPSSEIHERDIVDLAIHVSITNDAALTDMFISLRFTEADHNKTAFSLHNLVWKSSSVKALELLLHLQPDVDKLNSGGVTAAFVAAAKGHIEQLKLLHIKGADISFTVELNFIIKPVHILEKIEMIKDTFYNGYNLIHIAAQHGHQPVVKYISEVNNTLTNFQNSIGMRPSDIACENGDIDSLKTLAAYNKSFLDEICMHYAAKENRLDIVTLLIESGLELFCINNHQSVRAFNEIFRNIPVQKNGRLLLPYFPTEDTDDIVYSPVKPLDIWWKVLKENPLHVAIKSGSDSAALYLIEKFPRLLRCRHTLGYTSSLLAIVYNRTTLLPAIEKRLVIDTCKISNYVEEFRVIGSENLIKEITDISICANGSTVAHLLAIYPRELFLIFAVRQHTVDWNSPDSSGNYPLHYAAANSNTLFIISMLKLGADIASVQSRNGSTAFHIAAITSSFSSFYALTEKLQKLPSNMNDNDNRSVLHYVVLEKSVDLSIAKYLFQILIENFKYDIHQTDAYGRNVLHYALQFGHWMIVAYIQEHYPQSLKIMLERMDIEDLSPVPFALKRGKYIHILLMPSACKYYHIFNPNCFEDTFIEQVFSDWELALLVLMKNMSTNQFNSYIEPFLQTIIVKSTYLTTAVLVYYKTISDDCLQDLVLNCFSEFLHPSPYTLLSIAVYRPHILHRCNKPLSKSPMHLIMNNDYRVSEHFSTNHLFFENANDSDFFMKSLFGNPIDIGLLSCADENGYNIFHYSVMNGNIPAANYLVSKGVQIANTKVKVVDLFYMTHFANINFDLGFMKEDYTKYQNPLSATQRLSSDIFLTELLKMFKDEITLEMMCASGKSSLSLAHILAMCGFQTTLKEAINIFGERILDCENADGFTPVYFALLFQNIDMLPSSNISFGNFSNINRTAEDILILWILTAFPQPSIYSANCGMKHVIPWSKQLKVELESIEMFLLSYIRPEDANMYLHIDLMIKSLRGLLYAIEISAHILRRNALPEPCLKLIKIAQSICLEKDTIQRTSNQFNDPHLFRKASYLFDIMIENLRKRSHSCMKNCSCSNLSVVYERLGRFFNSLQHIVQVISKILRHTLLTDFLHMKEKLSLTIGKEFPFFQCRMKKLKFWINDYRLLSGFTSSKVEPVSKIQFSDLRRLRYLRVIRLTYVYQYMNRYLKKERYENHYFPSEKSEIKEPFKDMN